jgi:hypothetical protein
MQQVIIDFIDYVDKRTISQSLAAVIEKIGPRETRVVAIKILGWLKEMARSKSADALAFDENYPWCQNLLVLLCDIPQLNELFHVAGRHIVFRDTVPASDREEIAKYVHAHYNPKVRT